MPDNAPRKIEIFRAGTHTAMSGREVTMTTEDLDAIAKAYDPAVFAAPLVVGHPKTNDPAYGWVKSLSVEGDTLVAEVDDVDPEFAQIVRDGRYRKISASFYLPDSKQNPTPGVYGLRHVGFLGAAAPAVKGLKPVQFAADDELTIDFAMPVERIGWGLRSASGLWRRLRDWLLESEGAEVADRVVPDHEIAALADAGNTLIDRAEATSAFSEGENPMAQQQSDEVEKRARELEEREARLRAEEAAFAERQAKERKARNETFLDELVKAGKLAPAWRDPCLAFMETLDDEPAIDFAEGKDTRKESPLEFFRRMLGAGGAVVNFGEVSADKDEKTVDFSSDPVALAKAAREYMAAEHAKGNFVDAATAVRAVAAQQKG